MSNLQSSKNKFELEEGQNFQNPQEQNQEDKEKYHVLLGACLTYLVIGFPYSWGVVSVYVKQHFNNVSNTNYTQSQVNNVFPTTFLTQFIGMNTGMYLMKQFGARTNSLISGFGICFSLLIAGNTESFSIYLIFYGGCLGFFCGIAYIPALFICYSYFPDKKGLISGICMMSYGFSAVIIQVIMNFIINPHNVRKDSQGHFPNSVIDNVPLAIHLIMFYILMLSLGAAYLLREKQENGKKSEYQQSEQDIDPSIVYKSKFFLILLTMFSFSLSLGFAIIGNFKQVALEMSDQYLNLVVGNLGAFSNGGFRFVFGYLYDKYKFYTIYNFMLTVNVIIAFTFTFFRDSKFIFAIYVAIGAAIEGGHFSIFPPFTIECFGFKNGPVIYSRLLCAILLGNFGQQFVFQFLGDLIHFQGVFIFLGILNIVNLYLLNFELHKNRIQTQQDKNGLLQQYSSTGLSMKDKLLK